MKEKGLIFRKVFLFASVKLLIIFWGNLSYGYEWERTFGGSGRDYGHSVQQTTDGGFIIAGETATSSHDVEDVYLIKTDANGNEIWGKTFGGSNRDVGRSIQQTTDGGYIIAGMTMSYGAGFQDVYLVKTDAEGNEIWSKTFGGSERDDFGHSVQQTADGGYIIAGVAIFYDTDLEDWYIYGLEESDVYLIKTDAEGNEIWSKTFGGSEIDWGYSVQQTADGGFIIAGDTASYSEAGYDVYLIKTNADGNEIWSKTFGGSGGDNGRSVQQTVDGGFIIGGSTSSYGAGLKDAYLIKTDAEGNEIWSKTFGVSGNDMGYSVQQTTDGGYIVAGSTTATSENPGSYDVYLFKTDADGNKLWRRTFGGSKKDRGYSVQQTADGGYIITGHKDVDDSPDVYLIYYRPEAEAPTVTGDSGGGGGCFIATAAYGSMMEPHVRILREFRDRFLLQNSIGKDFIRLYNTCSPPIANFISKHDNLRAVVRISLLPFVGMSWVALKIGPVSTSAFMLLFISCFVGLVWYRRRYKN